jgi:hypothetical protein
MNRVISFWKDPAMFIMPKGTFKINSAGHGRRYLSVENLPFRADAFADFGFTNIRTEPVYKNFIGNHYKDGVYTHPHRDTAQEGYIHVRANWMIKKPQQGGDPVFDGEAVEVNEGDLWLCFSSEETHASTPIAGGERLICSFGALVKRPPNFSVKEFLK